MEPGRERWPKHMLKSAPGTQILGQGFLWKPQGTFLLLKAQAFSHPGPSSLSMSSLPASCLQCLCEAFTLGVTVTQEAEVKALSDQGHPLSSLHCVSPGPRHYKVWRLRLCLSPWQDAAFVLGRTSHARFTQTVRQIWHKADTDARESSESADTSRTSKGLAVTLGARGRTW